MRCVFALILAIFISLSCGDEDFPLVSTALGKVKGHYKTSYDGKKFAAFEGIPFAEPPVGSLRFQDPEPAKRWPGIWDATHLYECVQYNTWTFDGIVERGDEDCLYINVYVPHEKPIPNENLEVIVHIHGGAFMIGSGHFYTDPDYLMDRNVILVNFNYRLGIFGFLSTGDENLPGNYGLKDQTLALKWIQEHISSFGGNPDSVTLTGTSAGSASVHFHYISPWSKGLFHRGTAQSGVVLNPWVLQDQPLVQAKKLAVSLGCPDGNTENLVSCVRSRPTSLILDRTKLFYYESNVPIAPFAPVIDKSSPNPFVPDNPYFLLAQGKITNDVPLILSACADEGLSFLLNYVQDMESFNENWPKLAPYVLDYNFTVAKSVWESTANEIKEFYLGGKDFSLETVKELSNIIGDRQFTHDIETAARLQAKFSKSPIYFYIFNYEDELNFVKAMGLNINGVPHGSDIQYIHTNKMVKEILKKDQTLTDEARKMRDVFLDLLISFAKTGIPKVPNVEWKPTNYDQLTYLNISGPDDIKLQTAKELTPREFWKQLGILENQNIVLVKDEL